MQTGHNIRFGHKVWCDIQVCEDAKPEPVAVEEVVQQQQQPKEEVKQQPLPIKEIMENQDLGKSLVMPADDSSAFEEKKDLPEKKEEQPLNLSQSKTPKQLYFDHVAQVKDTDISFNLNQLYDFGYVSFETNYKLLQQHKNNLEMVLNLLLDGQQ